MTAAAAKKRRDTEATEDRAQESTERAIGLWVDESLLPTTLAKRGPPKQVPASGLPAPKTQDRLLHLADIALNGPRLERRQHDRRKKKVKYTGVERRSTR